MHCSIYININKEVSHVSHLSYVSHKMNDLHRLLGSK